MKYKKVLLKLSGETLSGSTGKGISRSGLERVAGEIKSIYSNKLQLAVVVGAGNIWRGAENNIERVTADHIGMFATLMNSLALCDVLKSSGIPAVVLSAFDISSAAESYSREKAVSYMKSGQVVIMGGGTGNPYFTTDTTAALRALEIDADVILKATQVDGVYDDDPKKNSLAKKYINLSFKEAIQKQLKIMDITAFSLCSENNMPIIVFDFYEKNNLKKIIDGQELGTLISER